MEVINYFDLGANMGYTIDAAIAQADACNVPITVYAIEANPELAGQLRERFKDRNVHVLNFAVTLEPCTVRLHKDPEEHLLGSSIYPDKRNVTEDFYEVEGRPFSEVFSGLDLGDGYNVIKVNIEGAEWDLVQDMVAHDMLDKFDLYLGSSVAGYWSKDMKKIPSLQAHVADINDIMDKAGILVKPFCGGSKDVNICEELGVLSDDD